MTKVKLTSEVISKLNNPKNIKIKRGLQKPLGFRSYPPVWQHVKLNEYNGVLTKESALRYLEDKLNMKREDLIEVVEE